MVDRSKRATLKLLGGTGAFLTAGIGTATARNGRRRGASGEETIVDVAVAADDFDVLVAAVQEAGLVETLSANRQLTVFAPTDAAFNAAGITVDNVGDVDDDFLFDVLTYHVTAGRRYSESVSGAPRLRMLNGDFVTEADGVVNGGQAELVATDIEASNGVVHVIDGVLLP